MKYSDIHIVLKINKTIVQGSYEFFESQLFNNFPANILLPIQFEKDLTQPQGIVYTFKLMKKIFLWEFLYCWKLLRLKLCFSIVLLNPQTEKSHYFVCWKFPFWMIIKNYDYNVEPCPYTWNTSLKYPTRTTYRSRSFWCIFQWLFRTFSAISWP